MILLFVNKREIAMKRARDRFQIKTAYYDSVNNQSWFIHNISYIVVSLWI